MHEKAACDTCPFSFSLSLPSASAGGKTFPARTFPPDGTTFAQVALGEKATHAIRAYGYWNMQFYHSEAAYVRFELGLPRSASLALYARRNALPTHTHHDVLHMVSGYKSRPVRAAAGLVAREVVQFLEPGHWFVSLYNDDGDPHQVTCLVTVARDMTLSCPRGCSAGNGECILGKCQCRSGFAGDDCSESKSITFFLFFFFFFFFFHEKLLTCFFCFGFCFVLFFYLLITLCSYS